MMQNRRAVRARTTMAMVSCLWTCGALACELPIANTSATLAGGVYCLDADVSADRIPAFTLGNNTVLDCRGHRIIDSTGATQMGVFASGDNITVKNCAFEGFSFGVFFNGVRNYSIVRNSFVGARNIAIAASGRHGFVSGNRIRYAPVENSIPAAVRTNGIVDIIDNRITSEGAPVPYERDIILSGSNDGGVISGNVIREFFTPVPTAGGIGILTDSYTIVYRNVLSANRGAGDIGVYCSFNGLALQNLITGYPRPYQPGVVPGKCAP